MTASAQILLATAVASARSKTGEPLQDKHTDQRRRGAVLDVLAHAEGVTGELLASLRSRRGFEMALKLGLMGNRELLRQAVAECRHPVSFAFLVPFVNDAEAPSALTVRIDSAYLSPLRKVEPGSVRHVAVVEVVRRGYKRWAMEVDRRDKESRRPL